MGIKIQIRGSILVVVLLMSVSLTSTSLADTYNYDATGRLLGVVYDDGSSVSYSYDANGNLLAALSDPVDPPPPNEAPDVTIVGGSRTVFDTDEAAGEFVSLSATATDSDGTIEATQWLIADVLVATDLVLDIALPDGDTDITFRATDNDGATTSETVTLTVVPPPIAPPARITVNSNGEATSAVIRGGIKLSGEGSFKADFKVGDSIQIIIVLEPDPSDIGSTSQIIVVGVVGADFLLVTPTGLLPWNGNIENVVAFDEIVLPARYEFNVLEVFGGEFTITPSEIGSFRFFVGYTTSEGNIIFNDEAIELYVTE